MKHTIRPDFLRQEKCVCFEGAGSFHYIIRFLIFFLAEFMEMMTGE